MSHADIFPRFCDVGAEEGASSATKELGTAKRLVCTAYAFVMQLIGLVLSAGFDTLSLAPLSVFEAANSVLGTRRYDVRVFSGEGGPVRSASGLDVITTAFADEPVDTIIVGAGPVASPTNDRMRRYLRDAVQGAARVAGMDLGGFALGDADLLGGRHATTRASYAAEFQRRFGDVVFEAEMSVVEDGPVWSSSSLVAGVELALCLVSHDLGSDLAEKAAAHLRDASSGSWPQPLPRSGRAPRSDRIKRTLAFARDNLRKSLPVEELADVACLSPRQFTRVFRLEVGHSPARAIEQLRLEAARQLLVQKRLPIELVAEETGFGGRERMRRAFLRTFGKVPRAMRDEAPA